MRNKKRLQDQTEVIKIISPFRWIDLKYHFNTSWNKIEVSVPYQSHYFNFKAGLIFETITIETLLSAHPIVKSNIELCL